MEIKVQITVKSQAGEPEIIQEVVSLKRGPLRPETLGLSLAKALSGRILPKKRRFLV